MLHRHGQVAWVWTRCIYTDMLHGYGNVAWTWKCFMDLETLHEHGNVAWTGTPCMHTGTDCSTDTDTDIQRYRHSWQFSRVFFQLHEAITILVSHLVFGIRSRLFSEMWTFFYMISGQIHHDQSAVKCGHFATWALFWRFQNRAGAAIITYYILYVCM